MKKISSFHFLLGFAIIFIGLTSCSTEDDITISDLYTLELDGRLDTTDEGLYKLELNSTQNSIQTIHRISGKLLNNGEEPYPQLVEWESSHNWILNDTAYVIVRRTINALGNWVTIDTSYVTGFNGSNVPTINEFSYSGTNGELNTVIAPIDNMVGDTLIVKARFEDLQKTIRIILE
jgi:hypothetical protein|tara:strand:+ start:141 stop:671 length:531 start_codon:yes stop_codon:yes gene_type:complete